MTAASAKYGVFCPKCGAAAEEPCRSLSTHRVTDTHAARIRLYWRERNKREAAQWGKTS